MTVAEIYSALVLEAGLPPGYVLDEMETYEVSAIFERMHTRYRESWEQTRFLAYVIAQGNSRKKLKLKDLIEFPWEKAGEPAQKKGPRPITEKEHERLRSMAAAYLRTQET